MNRLNYFKSRPKVPPINVAAYLHRLGVERGKADLAFLKKIHKAHLLAIPFENLDIHYGKKIILDIRPIFEKVILNKRGGFCFELNSLFYHLLIHLGYDAYLASARVFKDAGYTPEFDHMIIIVRLDGLNYLADVGFGSLFTEPKQINSQAQLDYTEYFKFFKDPDDHLILKRSSDGVVYSTAYKFDLIRREMIEFMGRCVYHQESPESHFKQNKLITQLFPEGRITLTDRKLKLHLKGELKELPVMNEDEFLSKLEDHFGVDSRALLRQVFD